MSAVLTHERFQHVPTLPQKRRRGRLPPGVVSIKHASRLRVGVLAEVVNSSIEANNGIRVVITHFDPRTRHCWLTKSFERAIRCSDGALDTEVSFKPEQLRRVWKGLSENERIQLRMSKS
jgi:hypothetical protein